jgi:hypothetical protein
VCQSPCERSSLPGAKPLRQTAVQHLCVACLAYTQCSKRGTHCPSTRICTFFKSPTRPYYFYISDHIFTLDRILSILLYCPAPFCPRLPYIDSWNGWRTGGRPQTSKSYRNRLVPFSTRLPDLLLCWVYLPLLAVT